MSDKNEITTLVSLFHTPERATEALQDLRAAGIPASAIQTLGGNSAADSTAQSMATLKSLNLPAKDLQVISEGMQSGGSLLVVRAAHDMAAKAEDIFESHHASQIDEQEVKGQVTGTKAAAAVSGEAIIPIVEEQLVIGKRKVQSGGMRVFSRMVETPVEEQVVLQEERARIERHAVNRPISSSELDALQNQTIEVREMAEEAVVGKTARVVEEITIGKETVQRTEQIKDSVRKTEVVVDELTASETKGLPGTR